MADTTLTSVPASAYAGDTVAWLLTYADFPASDGWTLTFGFRNTSGTIDLVSSASGDNHAIDADTNTTSQWLSGIYKGVARISNGTTSNTIWKGQIEVLQSLIEAGAVDTRSAARICLDNLLLASQGKASRDILNTTIAGQSIGRMTWTEITTAIAYWQDRVDAEQATEDAANGKGSSRNVLIRFGNA